MTAYNRKFDYDDVKKSLTPRDVGESLEIFISAPIASNIGNRRSVLHAATTGIRYNFYIPSQAVTITAVDLIGQVSSGAANASNDIDLTSDYCQTSGEAANFHTESDTATTYDFSGASGQLIELDLTSVLTSLTGGDHGGVQVKHNSIGGSMHYFGIRVRYTV